MQFLSMDYKKLDFRNLFFYGLRNDGFNDS